MESAVVARGKLFHRPALGHGSSHHAEWLALLLALEIAHRLGETDILLLGDSLAVVEQANGKSKCRSPELQHCLAKFQAAAGSFTRLRVRHIRRTQNLAGIKLGKIKEVSKG
jgi:ribonuclease HI